jgi:hypothetical protein
LHSRVDEPFPLDSEDMKLFEWHDRSDDRATSSALVESIGYHTVDGSGSNNDNIDDVTANEFSIEEEW